MTLESLSIKDTQHPDQYVTLWECHRDEDVVVAITDYTRYYSIPVAIAPADVDRLIAWLLAWKAERSPLAPRPSQLATRRGGGGVNETVRLKYDDAGFSLEGHQAGKIEIAAQVSQVELDAVEVVWLRDFLDEWLMLNHPDPTAAMCGKLFPASITVDSEVQP